MNDRIRALFVARDSSDRDESYQALVKLFEITESPVTWAYDVWDDLVDDLTHRDGHKRSFAAQMLTRLAISDPEGRMEQTFAAVTSVLYDPRTVTARHTLQSLWRAGLAGPAWAKRVVETLEKRFRAAATEKNGSLVRTDVVTALGQLATAIDDPSLERVVRSLIESEVDATARKRQAAAWRKAAS